MKYQQLMCACAAVMAVSNLGAAQTTHDVSLLPSNVFDPAELTIEVGDTVRWTWMGGRHNVVNGEGPPMTPGDGAVFDSGDPTSVVDTMFEHTFDTVGTFPYYCEPHFFVNMRGTITVGDGLTDLCAAADALTTEAAALEAAELDATDLDADGVPDQFQLALVQFAGCDPAETRADLSLATRTAFGMNFASLAAAASMYNEGQAKGVALPSISLDEVPNLAAALSVISGAMQEGLNAVTTETVPDGLEVVIITDDQGSEGAFTAAGDYDGDGTTNGAEYAEAVAQFMTPTLEQFLALVTAAPDTGEGNAEGASEGASEGATEGTTEGTTEGSGDTGGCAASAASSGGTSSGPWDTLIMLTLVMSVTWSAGRRHRLRRADSLA